MNYLYILLISALITFYCSSNGQAQNHFYEQNTDIVVTENTHTLTNAWTGGMNSMQFSDIDLNFDGIMDLFCFDRTAHKVITYINNGTPNVVDYTFAPEYTDFFPEFLYWVLLEDYNCDGKMDIFYSTPTGIGVYKNTSDISTGLSFQMIQLPFNGLHSQQGSNYTNIYCDALDIPSITDVDNDGDIDILSFSFGGGYMEYHKNLSMEKYGICDSLDFELFNQCWGHFRESSATNSVSLYDTCTFQAPNPELTGKGPSLGGERHSGSTVLALDMTGEGVKELILGDVSFTNLVGLYNSGTIVNSNSSMDTEDQNFPSYDVPVDFWLFPAAYFEDIDNDGVRDLLVSGNSFNQTEDKQSVHFYKNIMNDSVTDFSFVQNNIFQDEMMDFGTASKPVMFDYDNDGLKDLFVSNWGYFDRVSNQYIPKLALYKNTGTAVEAKFTLITDDFASLSTIGFNGDLYPTFGDIDGDGDKDMFLGDYAGQIHYFENIALSGANASFVLNTPYYEDNTGSAIDVGDNAAPLLIDIDRDGDLDMLIGRKQGRINFFENVGTSTAPSFEDIDSYFGEIDVSTIFDPGGHSVPTYYDYNGNYELLIGSYSGTIWRYDNIDGNIFGAFNLIDSALYDIKPGFRSTPFLAELSGDTIPELILGNVRGGLWFFDGKDSTINIGIEEQSKLDIKVYPNPTKDILTIQIETLIKQSAAYTLTDLSGRQILTGALKNTTPNTIDIGHLSNGVYLLNIAVKNDLRTIKVVKD